MVLCLATHTVNKRLKCMSMYPSFPTVHGRFMCTKGKHVRNSQVSRYMEVRGTDDQVFDYSFP